MEKPSQLSSRKRENFPALKQKKGKNLLSSRALSARRSSSSSMRSPIAATCKDTFPCHANIDVLKGATCLIPFSIKSRRPFVQRPASCLLLGASPRWQPAKQIQVMYYLLRAGGPYLKPDNIISGKNLASLVLIEFGNNSIFVLTTPGGFYPFPF